MTKDEIIKELLPYTGDIETNISKIKYDNSEFSKPAKLVIELKPNS